MTRRLTAILDEPWAIQPSYLPLIAALAQRAHDDPSVIEALAAKAGTPLQNTRTVSVRNGVAVIPVMGPIFPRANMLQMISGATSLEILAKDLNAALADRDVTAIMLHMDSPGGAVSGVGEFARMVFDARKAGDKPIAAYAAGACASAAYWIAAATGRIVVDSTAVVGSIGIVAGVSVQEAPDQAGMRTIEVVSSNASNKRPDPRTDEGVGKIRANLDTLESVFIAAVSEYRGVTTQQVIEEFGQGGVKVGAAAVRAGMADAVGSFESLLAELAAASPAARATPHAAAAADENGKPMSENTPTPVAPTETAQAVAAALAGERDRVSAIQAATIPGYEALAAASIASGESLAQFTAAQAAAERKAGAHHLEKVKADEAGIRPATPAAPAAPSADLSALPAEERAKAEWEKTPALRTEFGSLAAYTAFEKAKAAGRVRIFTGKAA